MSLAGLWQQKEVGGGGGGGLILSLSVMEQMCTGDGDVGLMNILVVIGCHCELGLPGDPFCK